MNNQPINHESVGIIKTVVSEQALKVLRNAYMLLALSMIPTVIGAYLGVSYADLLIGAMVNSPIVGMIVYLGLVFGLLIAIQKTADSAIAIPLMLAFTFVLGVALGPLLQLALVVGNGPALIAYAAGTTALIFFGLASYVTITGKDFSGLGKFLFVGLMIGLIGLIANLFFQMPAFSLAVSGFIILLMSMYILYNVSRIVHNGETNYILAALDLYLNIYILFTHLLRIMIILSGGRD
jgi:FtsH-binding integral membrane protein